MHLVLESTVKLEKNSSKQEKSLGDLESREQVVYNQISKLNSDEIEKIKELSNDAIEIAEERKEKIEQERKYILSAKKEFQKLTPLMEDIEEDAKKELRKVKNIMDERYSIYEEIYNTYLKGIKQDKKLYKLLQSEDVTLEVFQKQLEENNKTYKKVEELNNSFNEKTTQFNDSKQKFNKAAGLKVESK